MSAGIVFHKALGVLGSQRLPEVSERDLLAALEAARPGPMAFLYVAGAEAQLPDQTLLTRTAAIYYNFCAGNLADDLMDGDCTYLSEPFRLGPCVQYILQTLCFHTLMEANLRGHTLASAARDLVAAAGQQLIEVRAQQWSASRFRTVAEGIAARQWSAYMQILWCGTDLADRAVAVGINAGIAAHVAKDIQSQDPRYMTMPEADKREIVALAIAAAQGLREEHLHCLDALLLTIDPVLHEAS
jgi:hypothetical protein